MKNENTNPVIFSECIDTLWNICKKSKDSKIKEEYIEALEDIYKRCEFSYIDSESQKIKQKCIEGIIEILENEEKDIEVVKKCFCIFERKASVSEYLKKEKNTTLIKLYSKKIDEINNNQYNNKFVNKQSKTKQQKAEGNAMVL